MASQPDEQGSALSSQPDQVIGSDAYKQMEEALRASETRFRTQFESTPVPTFIWQVAGRQFTLIDVNAAAERLTLGKASTFLGITAEQLYADQPDLLERFQACLEQQAVIVYETAYHARGTGLDRVIVFTFAYVSPELILLHANDITEHRQAEDAHRAWEANMIALLENTDGSIWSVDREYRLIAGNSVFRRDVRTALGHEFAMGECVLSHAGAGAMNDRWRAYYDRALGGERFSVETRRGLVEPPNWYEYRLSPIYGSGGNITGVTVFGRDISARKQADETLRQSEERFRLAFENANDGVCLVGLDGHLLRVNTRMSTMFGYSSEELEGMTVNELTHPDYLEISPQFIHRAVQEQSDHDAFEKLYLHRDGHRVWGRVSSSLVRSDRGEPLYFISHVQDITARKQAEEAARDSVRYRTLVEQASDGIFLANPEGRYVEVNSAGCKLLGYTREELLQKTMRDVTDLPAEKPLRLDELRSGKVFLSERTMIRKDGSRVPVEISAKQLADGRFQGIVRDITERKQAEEERLQLLAQLAQAQKMETVGALAGGIAHEFNNMLAVILLRTEMALKTADPATPLHRNLTAIHTTAQRSAELVRQLLGFARKQVISPRVLNLNDAVESSLPMLRKLIGEEIEIVWHPTSPLWSVKMDPAQIDQILTNLCVNARDAIAGVGMIAIETANVTIEQESAAHGLAFAPGDYVILTMSDTGSGMDQATLAHIFDPFFTTKDVGKGAGLGLSTVDGIVQQNHGQIQVRSEPGIGTTFKVFLPRFAEATVATPAPQPAPHLPQGHGETVLLVEDEAVVLNMATEALQFLGYKVLAAATPQAALQLLGVHAGTIQLLITDVIMPEMNGHELATRMMGLQPGIRLLYMSGYPADFVASRGLLEAGVHFLQKPFALHGLAAKVREVLT